MIGDVPGGETEPFAIQRTALEVVGRDIGEPLLQVAGGDRLAAAGRAEREASQNDGDRNGSQRPPGTLHDSPWRYYRVLVYPLAT